MNCRLDVTLCSSFVSRQAYQRRQKQWQQQPVGYIARVVHKGRPQNMTRFYTPYPQCPQVSALDQSPSCGRPYSTLFTALWSSSVIASAIDFLHSEFDPYPRWADMWPPHPESKRCASLSTSPYYTLWHKSYKMNNNLQLVLRHRPYSVCKTCWDN